MLASTIYIIWPMHKQNLVLLHPTIKEKMHLQENTSQEILPSALIIMWPMHLQRLKLLRQKV